MPQDRNPAWLVWTLPLAVASLAAGPVVLPQGAPAPLWALWMTGPAYLIHQIEEHYGDRFRRYMNTVVLAGRPGMDPALVFWVNVPLVWGGVGAAMLAGLWNPAYGLFAPWLLIVNGVLHLAVAVVRRGYNPGLVTGVLVFPAVGGIALGGGYGLFAHIVGLSLAILAHVAIVLAVLLGLRRAR